MIPFIEDVPNNNGGDNQTVPEPRFILGLLATSLFVWRNKQKNYGLQYRDRHQTERGRGAW